jgi:hypothetical protein
MLVPRAKQEGMARKVGMAPMVARRATTMVGKVVREAMVATAGMPTRLLRMELRLRREALVALVGMVATGATELREARAARGVMAEPAGRAVMPGLP